MLLAPPPPPPPSCCIHISPSHMEKGENKEGGKRKRREYWSSYTRRCVSLHMLCNSKRRSPQSCNFRIKEKNTLLLLFPPFATMFFYFYILFFFFSGKERDMSAPHFLFFASLFASYSSPPLYSPELKGVRNDASQKKKGTWRVHIFARKIDESVAMKKYTPAQENARKKNTHQWLLSHSFFLLLFFLPFRSREFYLSSSFSFRLSTSAIRPFSSSSFTPIFTLPSSFSVRKHEAKKKKKKHKLSENERARKRGEREKRESREMEKNRYVFF